MTTRLPSNPATLYAETLVGALASAGLRHACIAPGSRSTPLTLAFAAHPAIRVWRHLDERSAGFFALGMALALEAPVALLCTSGTAGANFFPAIVEARMSGVPLLILTADRPPELRHSGANQTIDQVKLYGDQVLWSVDLPLPESDPPPVALRNLCTLAARALATAGGLRPGPVHLNAPFRKPFEPEREPLATDHWPLATSPDAGTVPEMGQGRLVPAERQITALAAPITEHPRGLIVCGPRCPGGDFSAAVVALSQAAGYPILADPLSGVRFGPWLAETVVSGGYETYLAGDGPGWEPPQVIVRFGAVPTSKALNTYLERVAPAHQLHIRSSGFWADDSHRVTRFLQADEALTCRLLAARLRPRRDHAWPARVRATERATWQALAEELHAHFFDGAVVADVVETLPPDSLLFVGNSLAVRHLDQFARPATKPLHTFANRGASGIDGNTSTALGLAAATGRPVVLVVGDITFYHDLNGLLPLRHEDLKLTVVLLNNGGGGIFHRLRVAAFDPPFTDLFLTPHGLNFAPAAEMYGLDYALATDRPAFREAFAAALVSTTSHLLEVRTGSAADHARRRELLAHVLAHLPDDK